MKLTVLINNLIVENHKKVITEISILKKTCVLHMVIAMVIMNPELCDQVTNYFYKFNNLLFIYLLINLILNLKKNNIQIGILPKVGFWSFEDRPEYIFECVLYEGAC